MARFYRAATSRARRSAAKGATIGARAGRKIRAAVDTATTGAKAAGQGVTDQAMNLKEFGQKYLQKINANSSISSAVSAKTKDLDQASGILRKNKYTQVKKMAEKDKNTVLNAVHSSRSAKDRRAKTMDKLSGAVAGDMVDDISDNMKSFKRVFDDGDVGLGDKIGVFMDNSVFSDRQRLDLMGGAAKNYLTKGTKSELASRWGAVGAGYFGVNAIGRGVTGGSGNINGKGEKDIMGVPFV